MDVAGVDEGVVVTIDGAKVDGRVERVREAVSVVIIRLMRTISFSMALEMKSRSETAGRSDSV